MSRGSAAATAREPLTARAAAAQAVQAALHGDAFAAEQIRAWRTVGALAARDAALALEIAQGAIRHVHQLDRLLRPSLRVPRGRLDPAVRAVLLTAAYQVVWLAGVPVYAAVDEAVALARTRRGARSAGFVNAVLRKLSGAVVRRAAEWQPFHPRQVRTGWATACEFAHDVLPACDAGGAPPGALREHLAAATGETSERFRVLAARFGAEAAEAIAWASQAVPPIVLQRNAMRATAEEFAVRIAGEFGESANILHGAAFLPAAERVADAALFSKGLAYVQDATAYEAAAALAVRPGERVLDLCAAPGGKSVTLAIKMRDCGEVVACDVSDERLARVRENAARLGLKIIRARLTHPGHDAIDPNGDHSDPSRDREGAVRSADDRPASASFDAALVDVPCSNSGVIARRPEARLRLSPRALAELTRIQRDLLRRAADAVAPGGRLVYSTCSIEPEENEQVVTAFVQSAGDEWIVDEWRTARPAWGARLTDWRDGGFWAKLARRA